MKSENQSELVNAPKKVLSLGFSPCPNDTFMFDALVNGRIESPGLSFDTRLEDVETLNRLALRTSLDITKLSYAAYAGVADKYQLLTSGSALGFGVGPLFISKKKFTDLSEIKSIAIPGHHTTAFFLFKMFFPELINTKEYVFSEIEDAILNEAVDAGVIIHENRFTYESRGLKKIADLGKLWEEKTGLPIPLGGIAIKRSLGESTKRLVNELVRESVNYAFAHPADSKDYVREHSQEMDEIVIAKHIQLYVNKNSIDLDENAKEAIRQFLELDNLNDRSIFVASKT